MTLKQKEATGSGGLLGMGEEDGEEGEENQ